MKDSSFHSARASARRRRLALTLLQAEQVSQENFQESAAKEGIFLRGEPAQNQPSQMPAQSVPEFLQLLQANSRLTWLFTGDSLSSVGEQPARGGCHVSYLMRMLRDRLRRTSDAFVSTEMPEQQLSALSHDLAERVEKFDPNIVVLTFGFRELADAQESSLAFERLFQDCVQRLCQRGITIVVNLPPYHQFDMEDHSADRLIRLEALRACTQESSLLLVDHWSHWEKHAQADWYRADGIHPSERGAIEMARLFIQELGLDELMVDEISESRFTEESPAPPLIHAT